MQAMLTQIDDHQAIQILLKHLVDTDKDLRYDLILKQIEDTIVMHWLDFVHKRVFWKRPVKCTAKFHLNDEHGFAQPDSSFALSAQLDYIVSDTIDDYVKRIRNALRFMRFELRNKHDLDNVVFDIDPDTGREAITVGEVI